MSRVNRQAGMAQLISMLVVCLILMVLSAIAIPNIVASVGFSNATDMRRYMRMVTNANAIAAQCAATAGCTVSPAVTDVIPAAGTQFMMDSFTVTMSPAGAPFSISAIGQGDAFAGPVNLVEYDDLILRCEPAASDEYGAALNRTVTPCQ